MPVFVDHRDCRNPIVARKHLGYRYTRVGQVGRLWMGGADQDNRPNGLSPIDRKAAGQSRAEGVAGNHPPVDARVTPVENVMDSTERGQFVSLEWCESEGQPHDDDRIPVLGQRPQKRSIRLGCNSTTNYENRFLTQMYARFSPRRVRHRSGKTPRMCPCPVRSGAVVCRSVDGRLRGPALGVGPARRQPDQTQAADSMALTWRRTVKASGTRPRLSPTFYARAEPSLTVQPPWSWQPRHDSAVCCGRTFREPATALQIRAVFFSHVSH